MTLGQLTIGVVGVLERMTALQYLWLGFIGRLLWRALRRRRRR